MTPLFKTHASLGKSILTSDLPSDKQSPENADSIFSLALEAKLREIFVIETTMTNIFELMKNSLKLGIELRYGLEFKVSNEESWFKQSFLAANAQGVRDLMELYSKVQTEQDGYILEQDLATLNCENLHILCNFYDGWIHKNLLAFGTFMPKFSKEPYYQIESNDLMIDRLIENQIKGNPKRMLFKTKSILYKNRADIDAFLVYKLACGTKQGGRRPTLNEPGLDGFSSREFCWESWKEARDGKLS